MKKYFAVLLALAILSSFVACKSKSIDDDSSTSVQTTEKSDEITSDIKENTDDKKESTIIANDIAEENFKLEKIGKLTDKNLSCTKYGIKIQNDSGKYAIISLDGKKKTKYKYTNIEDANYGYCEVRTIDKIDVENINSLNSNGLVNSNAEEVLPTEYALLEPLNERYIYVAKVTGFTDSKEESLIYFTDGLLSINGSQDDDIRCKGVWQIYDTVKKRMVSGATDTLPCSPDADGNFIRYYKTESSSYIYIDENGKEMPEGTVRSDGSYYTDTDGKITLYDTNGKKLISVSKDYYTSVSVNGDYFDARKKAEQGYTTYVLLDKQGNEISAEFDNTISVYGNVIEYDDYIYNFKGEKLIDKKYTSITLDPITKKYYLLSNSADDGEVTIIDRNGNILYSVPYHSNSIENSLSDFAFYNRIENGKYNYYSFKSKKFKYIGNSVAPWLVSETATNDLKKVINTTNDKVLLDGYKSYSCVIAQNDTVYIYAHSFEDFSDIYILK